MKWFKHDSNSNRDPKLEKVLMKFGADGYALYWMCLELISEPIDKNNINFELEHDAEILAFRLKIDSYRVEEIMKYMVTLQLFETNPTNQKITCLKLASRIENSIVKSPQLKEIQNKLTSKSSKRALDIPDNPGQSQTTQDYQGRVGLELDRDIDLEENKNLEKDYKEKNTKKENIPYPPSSNKLSTNISEAINHWNDKGNLPACKYSILNLPKISDIREKFDVFRDGEILTAINNLSKSYESLEQTYRPKNFQNFICNSLDNWFEEREQQSTMTNYPEPRTPEERVYLSELRRKESNMDLWNDELERKLENMRIRSEQSLNPEEAMF